MKVCLTALTSPAHAHVYILEKSQHKVPEEALKHEKYTSQLQLSLKALEAKTKEKHQSSEKSKDFLANVKLQDRSERRAQSLTAGTDSPICKPSPLYGQPSWWGEDEDSANKKLDRDGKSSESPEPAKDVSRYELNGSLSDAQPKSTFSYRQEPNYYEIPTKEPQSRPAKKLDSQVHEIPTKDTPDPTQCVPSTPTPPVVQSHASFTIEFDECTPGKMKIKDHVTKFSFRQQRKSPSAEAVTTPTEVVSAASKVADWLVQSNASMMRRKSYAEDQCSTNSDSTLLKTTKADHCEVDTHSDSGIPAINGNDILQSEPQTQFTRDPLPSSEPEPQSLPNLGRSEPHQAFVIEFFDDASRKKRSQSFTSNIPPPEPLGFRAQLEKSRKSSSPNGDRQTPVQTTSTPPTQRYTIPLKGPAPSGPQRAGSLRREKTEEQISTSFSSRSSSSSVSARPFSSVGRRSKLARDFTAEFLKQAKQSSASWEKNTSNAPTAAKAEPVVVSKSSPPPSRAPYQPQTSSPIHRPVPLKAPLMTKSSQSVDPSVPQISPRNEEDDSLSDAGTYTIETDIQDRELEEARSKIDQVQPAGAPKWMSRWASLADTYTDSGPSSGLFDIPSQMELSGGARGTIIHKATLSRHSDTADSDGSRTHRVLPQEPLEDKSDVPTPSIHVHYDLHSTFDVEQTSLSGPRSEDNLHRLSVQDDVEPDSLSDASKSDDGSIIEQKRRPVSDTEEKKKDEEKVKLPVKSTSFYIGSEDEESKLERGGSQPGTPRTERKATTKSFSTATLTKPRKSQDKANGSAPDSREGTVSPLIRQESFTKERPSNARLPNISSLSIQRDGDAGLFQAASSQDTHSYLKETENVLASLEAKLQAGHSEKTPSPVADSLSGESDVDTSSTVSQQSSKTQPNTLAKKPSVSSFHRERSSASIASQDSVHLSTDKRRAQGADSKNKTEFLRRPVGLRRSIGKRGSTDLSDDPQSLPYSDQESSSLQTHSRKYTVPLQKEDGKTSRMSQSLSRASSLSAPRPTRASMLRRARLGEASDNEAMETDKPSQEAGTSAKPPQETKKLSRLDMLAMPRKRTSSFTTPSDTEASSAPQWAGRSSGFSNRSTESGTSSFRRASAPGPKPAERPQKAGNSTPLTRVRSSSAKYASSTASSRRRQKGSDYTSTSDEEYDSNQSTPKYKRSQPSSASHSPRTQPRPRPVVALRPKSRSRDSEEETHEGETFHSWSNHSAEIARLSQDLAKDLAILAREIHDVAGDGDPPNPAAESSAPFSAVTAHEQLVHQIPEAGLNYQRVPPRSTSTRDSDRGVSSPEQNSRRSAASKDEAPADNLMLNPMSEIITAIRENTEQLADKIKVLFQDRMDIWHDIEAKANSDSDVPAIKNSSEEVVGILKELRRVQRQLELINTVMEPSGQREPSKASTSALSSSGFRSRPSSTRDFRSVLSASKRSSGHRSSESARRAAVTPDDVREGYLV
ncbi:uncharacterized protein V6R79_025653 [Siganus canaliculatus]